MGVYTTVTAEHFADWLRGHSIGSLFALEGIAGGVENTNYFVTTSRGRHVLTLFGQLCEIAKNPFLQTGIIVIPV